MSFGFKDFDAFGRWYTERRRRSTGRSASPNTLRTKQVHLARICNEMGYQEGVFLCHALCDRREVVFILDRLAAKMPPGAMRVAVYRSDERRVGKEGVSKCRARWSTYRSNKTKRR